MTKRPTSSGVGRSASEREARHFRRSAMPYNEIRAIDRSCKSYRSSHQVHGIQAKKSVEEEQPVIEWPLWFTPTGAAVTSVRARRHPVTPRWVSTAKPSGNASARACSAAWRSCWQRASSPPHPASRKREQPPVLVPHVDPILTPVLPMNHELELATERRMKPMRVTRTFRKRSSGSGVVDDVVQATGGTAHVLCAGLVLARPRVRLAGADAGRCGALVSTRRLLQSR